MENPNIVACTQCHGLKWVWFKSIIITQLINVLPIHVTRYDLLP